MRPLLIAAGLAGFAAVALGAFGAHGLVGRLSPEALGWWETATLYALVHAVAALCVALHGAGKTGTDKMGVRAGAVFILGTVLFSGSLYAMALFSLAGGAPGWFGMITPLGGLSFLAGWALIIAGGVRQQ